MRWFRRKPKVVKDAIPDAPYSLDSYDRNYRVVRIQEIAEIWNQSLAYTAERLDQWVIHPITGSRGGDDLIELYIPRPLWDDEWLMTRDSYVTREQAEAHVASVGGRLVE